MTQATQTPQTPATDTPAAMTPATPDELAQLKAQVEQLSRTVTDTNQRLSEKDRTIQDLNQTRAVLEARVAGIQPQQVQDQGDSVLEATASRILEEGLLDPASAGKKLSKLILDERKKGQQEAVQHTMQNLQPAVELQVFEAQIKQENKDLYDLGFEPVIQAMVREKLRGKNPSVQEIKEAAKQSIIEKREQLKALIQPATPTPPAAAPKGAVGETGSNVTPPASTPTPVATTQADEVQARIDTARNKGLY